MSRRSKSLLWLEYIIHTLILRRDDMISRNYDPLIELDKLEKLSLEYAFELEYLSKRIRNDIWIIDKNSQKLAFVLSKINMAFSYIDAIIGKDYYTLDTVIEYIKCLSKYSFIYSPHINPNYFDELINDVQLKGAEHIVEQQWVNVFNSDNGYKSFIDIFDDIFTNAIDVHREQFFHEMNSNDILCRIVEDSGCGTERFIPYPSKTNNRWNPPGRQFLYLSFCAEEQQYSESLKLSEYICTEEIRAKKGYTYSFCNFTPIVKGQILDLSYNDISMTQIKSTVDEYYYDTTQKIIDEMLNEKDAYVKYLDKKKLKKAIKKKVEKNGVDKKILEQSYAKQYLKMICNCIYKKVDETDETKREQAYKSFHILSRYLEEKGVTGIIYPCTRTNKVQGKNIVIFNVNDAIPIPNSIREYLYV